MNLAKRLTTVEKALELLLQLEKYYILLRADDTPEEATKWHVEQGQFDPEKQRPVFILSKIPGKLRRTKCVNNFDLPEAPIGKKEKATDPFPPHEPYELIDRPEPKPEKPTRIWYPEGSVPY